MTDARLAWLYAPRDDDVVASNYFRGGAAVRRGYEIQSVSSSFPENAVESFVRGAAGKKRGSIISRSQCSILETEKIKWRPIFMSHGTPLFFVLNFGRAN